MQARNAVQYRLLCLPPADTLAVVGSTSTRPPAAETFLYEICRLGFLIFSNMVLFPLPAESGVAKRLTGLLRDCLLDAVIRSRGAINRDSEWRRRHSGVLIWATLLACMAAPSASSDRAWYVSCLAHVMAAAATSATTSAAPDPAEWPVLEDQVLSRHIWWRYTCSRPGQRVWAEACSKLKSRAARSVVVVPVDQTRPPGRDEQ